MGSCWDHSGIVLESCWFSLGIIWGSVWDHFGISLGHIFPRGPPLTPIGSCRDLHRVKQVYALLQQRSMKPGAAHIQTSGTHTDPGNAPAKFKKYDKNAGGGRVVAMLEEILADTRN